MNEIKVFNYESAAIRTVSIAGEPWWVAKDICDAIGLTNPTEAVKSVDADDLSRAEVIDTMGRKQSANIVNESGLYTLILRSEKPEAKAFKKWITSEVLPSIRKTGSYTNPKFVVPQTYPEALRLAANLAEENETMRPKALIHDRIADAKGYKTIREVAAILNIGANTLFALLRDMGILYRENTTNLPKREHIEAGRFIVIEEPFQKGSETCVYSKVLVTPKGELWLAKILEEYAA